MSSAYVDVDAKDVVLTWRPRSAADVELTGNKDRISATPMSSYGGQLVVNLRDPQRLGAVSVPKARPPVPSKDPSAPERHSDDDESPAAADGHSEDDSSSSQAPGSTADAVDSAAASAAEPARPTVPTSVRHAAYPTPIAVADLAQAAAVEAADDLRSAILKIGAPKAEPVDLEPPLVSDPYSVPPPAPGQGEEYEIIFVDEEEAEQTPSASSGSGQAEQAASAPSASGGKRGTKRKEPEATGSETCGLQ